MADVTRSTPEDGDLVIRQDRRDGEYVYVLHTAPGADQFLLRSCEEAVAHATAFARRQRVRVWRKEGPLHFRLVQNFRDVS